MQQLSSGTCFHVRPGFQDNPLASIKKKIAAWHIEMKDFNDWPGFSQDLYSQRDLVSAEVGSPDCYGNHRGESQCIAEAEVVIIYEIDRPAFLSQTNIFNKLPGHPSKSSWKPEAMYRFLSLFSSTPPDADFLYNSMIQDFYYAGFDIVDKDVISRFIAPIAHQARMQIDSERTDTKKLLDLRCLLNLGMNLNDSLMSKTILFYAVCFLCCQSRNHKEESC